MLGVCKLEQEYCSKQRDRVGTLSEMTVHPLKCDKEFFSSLFSQFALHISSNINLSHLIRQYQIKADGSF